MIMMKMVDGQNEEEKNHTLQYKNQQMITR